MATVISTIYHIPTTIYYLCYTLLYMSTLKDFRDERLRKLKTLQDLELNPYPAEANRTHNAGDIIKDFDKFESQDTTVAGRIMGLRKFGKLAFIVLRDFSGQIQLFLKICDFSLDRAMGLGY